MTDIATRFASDTAEHKMTVLHDDGLYRHLRFQAPGHSSYWFDLITMPGTLIFQGDGDSFVFRRTEDMFAFFRGSAWQGKPNPQYWAEKLTSGDGQAKKYNRELLRRHVDEAVAEAMKDEAEGLAGLADAVRYHLIDEWTGDESLDRNLVERFRFWANPNDEFAYPRKAPDFEFHDVWEWTTQDYHWWFLWVCQAIVWGIAQYDRSVQPVPAKAGA